MKTLYHLIQKDELALLKKSQVYQPHSLAVDGFIHLAYEAQLSIIIQQFFVPTLVDKGELTTSEALQEVGLYLVEIDTTLLTAKVVDELPVGLSPKPDASLEPIDNKEHSLELIESLPPIESPKSIESTDRYPHLYGGLHRDAIVKISPLKINTQGDYLRLT